MTQAKAFLLAARPKTLPAAVCPVVAGSALAWRMEHTFSWMLAIATLLSTLAIQVATNYFNDAVDAAKGADTTARLGPVRATAAGLVSRKTMMLAGAVAALVAAGFAVPLILERGWPIVLIGVVSLFFSYGYTGGPWPLAYRGLGEIFVMLFFGFVAVMGTVYVQTGRWDESCFWPGLLAGFQVGALSTALIAINNLRDIEEDARSGKRTLAVRAGKMAARIMITGWCLLPYAAGLLWLNTVGIGGGVSREQVIDAAHPGIQVVMTEVRLFLSTLFWMPLPAAIIGLVVTVNIWRTEPSAAYNRLLALAGLHLLMWTILFTVACVRS
jgi:1,4-dihydroxy-2-naphthoate octaprenyltransferase